MNYTQALKLTMFAAKKRIYRNKGKSFYDRFYKETKVILREIVPLVPDLKGSLFQTNYQFGICYIAWFKALKHLGYDDKSAVHEIWRLNEDFFHLVPQPIMRLYGRHYLRNWRKKAPDFEKKGSRGELHPLDYRFKYMRLNNNTFELDFTDCALKKLCTKFDVMDMMPEICRIDYLMFNCMGVGFERTKTLGDGDDCCNCRYSIKGKCEWSPEKGFTERK